MNRLADVRAEEKEWWRIKQNMAGGECKSKVRWTGSGNEPWEQQGGSCRGDVPTPVHLALCKGSTRQTDKSLCGELVCGMVPDLLKRAYRTCFHVTLSAGVMFITNTHAANDFATAQVYFLTACVIVLSLNDGQWLRNSWQGTVQ